MDLYPLWNSLRIAFLSTVIIFFVGIFVAYYIAKAPRAVKGVLDVILTLPMVLPPTVCGYFLLLVFGPRRPLGGLLLQWGIRVAMNWYGGIAAAVVVSFPLMYRTARGAFEQLEPNVIYAARTLGISEWRIFWHVLLPNARSGILAGLVLSFTRALGEFGATIMFAGNIPGKTQTMSTAIYAAVQANDYALAFDWAMAIVVFSLFFVVLMNWWIARSSKEGCLWS